MTRSRSVLVRPNGTGSGDPARTRSISPNQNGSISDTWARISGGPQSNSGPSPSTSFTGHGSAASIRPRSAAIVSAAVVRRSMASALGVGGVTAEWYRATVSGMSRSLPPNVTIEAMRPGHWPAVRAIHQAGILGGNATIDREPAADWSTWSDAHRPDCRLVALDPERVLGWVALSPYSHRQVYSG